MDQVTVDFLQAMDSRLTAKQSVVENQLSTMVDRLASLQTELVGLRRLFLDAHLLESDENLAGQIYEYDGALNGLARRTMESVEAITRLRRSVKQLDEVDTRVGDPLRSP